MEESTETFLNRIRETVKASEQLIETVGLRIAETDRLLAARGLSRAAFRQEKGAAHHETVEGRAQSAATIALAEAKVSPGGAKDETAVREDAGAEKMLQWAQSYETETAKQQGKRRETPEQTHHRLKTVARVSQSGEGLPAQLLPPHALKRWMNPLRI